MTRTGGLLLRNVEIYGHGIGDCRIRDGLVTETSPQLRAREDETVVEGRAGALLPGLADHHLHLTAMAARTESLDVSALSADTLARELARATPRADGWIRAVGYDDVLHGDIDRHVLDRWNAAIPLRVQHRSGALWVLNSAGIDRLGPAITAHDGIERDSEGRPTGRLWRADALLREALGAKPPSLVAIGRQLAAFGITHVADATPDAASAEVVIAAAARGELPHRVMVMTRDTPPIQGHRVGVGPVKLVVADHAPPEFDELVDGIRQAHAESRPVAVHCVTQQALALTLAALDAADPVDGDRIEHCAVADESAVQAIAIRGLRVVTQPTLVTRRGDQYWDRSAPEDRPHLWRYASLLDAGVRVVAGSDAPYGDPDPWTCLRSASHRRTASGRILGPGERVPAPTVLRGLLSPLHDPGGLPRRIEAGEPADLVLLDCPLDDALRLPDSSRVRATLIGGEFVYTKEQQE